MKKIALLTLCVLLALPLAACGGSKDPGPGSVYDSDGKNMLSLGDEWGDVVKKLGEGTLLENSGGADWYAFNGGTLTLALSGGNVVAIVADNEFRYSTYNYRRGTFLVEVKERFAEAGATELFGIEYISYTAYYDAGGNLLNGPTGAYSYTSILCTPEDFAKMMVGLV